jgi:hypothetical protein
MYITTVPPTSSIPCSAYSDFAKHTFSIALAPGDVLVLATDEHDEYHLQRDKLYPVSLFYMDAITDSSWRVVTTGRKIILGQTDVVQVHPFLSLAIKQPLKIVHTAKGKCTVFRAEVTHGYRLHFIDYVQRKLPDIYRQLHLD